MSKYIDAGRLKAEIEKRMHICDGVFERDSDTYYQGKAVAYKETLPLIDSLQQGQPDVDLDADIEMEWDSFNKHLVEYGEEPEEVIWLNWNSFVDITRYFYELGLKRE